MYIMQCDNQNKHTRRLHLPILSELRVSSTSSHVHLQIIVVIIQRLLKAGDRRLVSVLCTVVRYQLITGPSRSLPVSSCDSH